MAHEHLDVTSALAHLALLKHRADARELTAGEAAAMYDICGQLREQANYYERALIRSLRYTSEDRATRKVRMVWREIEEVLGVDSRQGAHQRWNRFEAEPPSPSAQRDECATSV